jgi:hypothetical protein
MTSLISSAPRKSLSALGQIELPDECPIFALAVAEQTVANPPTAVLRAVCEDPGVGQFA